MDKVQLRSEQLVLNAILTEPTCIHKVMARVSLDMFELPMHKTIFENILKLYLDQQPINLISVYKSIQQDKSIYSKTAVVEISNIHSMFSPQERIELESAVVLLTAESIRHEHIELGNIIIKEATLDTYDPKKTLEIIQSHISDNKYKTLINKKEFTNEDLLVELDKRMADAASHKGVSGIETGYKRFDIVTSGMQPTNLIIVAARPAMGKELKNDSLVYTPDGNKRIGDMKVGDKILGSDGNEYNVTGVFPQGKKDVYRIWFDDGSYVDSGLEHQWEVSTRKTRKYSKDAVVMTTKQMLDDVIIEDGRKNYSIRFCKPLKFKEKRVNIHPYIIGALIGDGGLTQTGIKFSNTEQDIIDKINALAPENHKLSFNSKCTYGLVGHKQVNLVLNELKSIGLHETKSHQKFIPKDYLYNSVDNRIELLRGLVDTDGYTVGGNAIEYCTTSYQLCLDVLELVRGLGGKASYSKKKGSYRKNGIRIEAKDYYRMYLSLPEDIIPVSSKKHLAKYRASKKFHAKFIKEIQKMDYQEDMTCISVDAPDCLYVTDGYTLTHNTQYALGIMRHASIKNNKKGLFISCEMDEVQVMKRIIAVDSGIPGYHIKRGNLQTSEVMRYEKARQRIIDSNLRIVAGSFTIADVLSLIYKMKHSEGLDYVVVDYIQKITSPGAQNRTNEVGDVSRRLKDLANELKIPIVALAQLSRAVEHRNDKKPMLSDLRESGDIEQDADIVMFLYRAGYYMDINERQNNPLADDGYAIIAKHRDGELEDIQLKFDSNIPAWKNPDDRDEYNEVYVQQQIKPNYDFDWDKPFG